MNEPQSEYLSQDNPPQLTSVITIGALTIDLSLCNVSIDGQPVMLGAQDYKALVYLARNAGRVVAKDELWREVWGCTKGGTKDQLTSCIRRIRLDIEPDPKRPCYVLTSYGHGYYMPVQPNNPLMKDSSV